MRIPRSWATRIAILCVAALSAAALDGCSKPAPATESGSTTPQRGGRLVATARSSLSTFNRIVAPVANTEVVSRLTQARLVRLNRVTRAIEPSLAKEWTSSPDGLIWTFTLHDGLKFSDGTPLTSADVLFSFQALYDKRVNSAVAPSLLVGGKPLQVRALDARTIVITFPAPFGPGIAMLDALPILPSHKLKAALDAGTFVTTWGPETPPAELVGAGPFVVREHVLNTRVVFARNPHYWKRDDAGQPLPYLDEIELQFVKDQNTEVLRLEAGAVDVITDQIRPEDLRQFQELERQGRIRLSKPGVTISPDLFWINLSPTAPSAKTQPWLQEEAFRKALSHAIDRQKIADTVYLGNARPIFGPITPGHGEWFLPDLPRTDFDPARAKTLLASIGLTDRTGDGLLEDTAGKPVRFSVVTQKGHAARERTASMVKEHLRQVGVDLDVVALDMMALGARLDKRDYDAAFFFVTFDSFDPSRNLDYWLSSGHFHLWNPGQAQPAQPWEGEIDRGMLRVSSVMDPAERYRLFAGVQRTMAEHTPAIYFVAPEVIVATGGRVHGATPSVLQMPVLWNAERLWLTAGGAAGRE